MRRRGLDSHTALGVALLGVALGGHACTPAPPAEAQGRERPVRGGTLRIVQEEPLSLDPRDSSSVYDSLPVNQIFDTLVTVDPSMTVRPGLAETWTISRDGTEYVFTLRAGVKFHDGTSLTADDVAFSLERQIGSDTSLASSYLMVIDGAPEFAQKRRDDIPGIEIVDARTIHIRLARPYVSFLEVLAIDNLGVVPRALVRERGAAFARSPVGTGPFRFVSWNAGDRLVLEANETYFAGRPHLERFEIHFLRESESDLGAARFLDGDVDVIEPSADLLPALARTHGVVLHRYQVLSLSFLGLNAKTPPLDRPWLRRAIAHAIDREALVREAAETRREAAGILPPGIPGYTPEPKALAYDPDEARRILADAGHPGGAGIPPIRLENPSRNATAARVLGQIRNDLAAVGLSLDLVPVTWPELGTHLDNGIAPAFLLGWVADLTDPDAFLRSLFEADGSGNYFGHNSRETERLLDLGTSERNPETRARIYRELERHILNEAPIVPLYHTMGIIATHDRIRGLSPSPLGLAELEMEKVWLLPEERRS
jgi:oligopeptide transport system substrate-binding protein